MWGLSDFLKVILKLIAICAIIITITFGAVFLIHKQHIEQFMSEYNTDLASVDNKPLDTGIVEAHFEREHVEPRFFTDTITHSYHIEVDGVEHELDVSLWSKLEKGQQIEYQITDKGRLVNVEPIQAASLDEPRESNALLDMN